MHNPQYHDAGRERPAALSSSVYERVSEGQQPGTAAGGSKALTMTIFGEVEPNNSFYATT